jgi:hypothetical protein
LLTFHNRHHQFEASFLINIYSGTKWCPSVLETVGLPVPTRNIRNFTMFTCSSSHFPSSRCVSAANVVCKHRDNFDTSCFIVKSLNWSIFSIFCFFFLSRVVLLLLFLFVLSL